MTTNGDLTDIELEAFEAGLLDLIQKALSEGATPELIVEALRLRITALQEG